MLIIDNTQNIQPLLQFDDSNRYYYKFVALARRKDYDERNCIPGVSLEGNHGELIIRTWLVSSINDYGRYLDDMVNTVASLHVRLYITLDVKDFYKSLMYVRNRCTDTLDQIVNGQTTFRPRHLFRMFNSMGSTSETSGKYKRWLFDIDTKDTNVVATVEKACQDSWICTLPTKNGYHVIANKNFNANALDLGPFVDIKSNALALVAVG